MIENVLPVMASGNNGGLFGGDGGGVLTGLLFGGLLGGNGGFGLNNRNGGGELAVGQLSQQIQDVQNQVSQNAIHGEIDELQSAFSNGLIATMGGIKDNANLYLSGTGNILTAQANGNFSTLNSINGAVGTITTQNYNQSLQNLNSMNGLTSTILQSFNENSRDNANAFNSIQNTLQQNAMQAAMCCCDLKNAIHSDGEQTRALITQNLINELQAKLGDAKNTISDLNQTNALIANNALQTNIILQHLAPYSRVS